MPNLRKRNMDSDQQQEASELSAPETRVPGLFKSDHDIRERKDKARGFWPRAYLHNHEFLTTE